MITIAFCFCVKHGLVQEDQEVLADNDVEYEYVDVNLCADEEYGQNMQGYFGKRRENSISNINSGRF